MEQINAILDFYQWQCENYSTPPKNRQQLEVRLAKYEKWLKEREEKAMNEYNKTIAKHFPDIDDFTI